MNDPGTPIVFVGPSAPREELAAVLPTARFAPPVARDELYRAREQGASVFLVLDGMFMHRLAVSPREVVDVLRDGALVLGAASMGALRGAECWPAGMLGLGAITRLFRLGWLEGDDEVAVATDAEDGFTARSVALVNVRYAASKALRLRALDRASAAALVEAATRLYFPERRWPLILRRAGVSDPDHSLASRLAGFDLKRCDAVGAARVLACMLQATPGLADAHARRHDGRFDVPERYPGHDRFLGHAPDDLAGRLTRWLFGSGRYQPYVWALAAGEPELREVAEAVDADSRAEGRRDALAAILARWLADVEALALLVVAELDFMDELDAELMRWHAVQSLAASTPEPSPDGLQRVRHEVAIAHGVVDWDMLCEEVIDGRLFGAIPLPWIENACLAIARARASKAGAW